MPFLVYGLALREITPCAGIVGMDCPTEGVGVVAAAGNYLCRAGRTLAVDVTAIIEKLTNRERTKTLHLDLFLFELAYSGKEAGVCRASLAPTSYV